MTLEEGLSPLPLVVLMGTASQGILKARSAWIPPIVPFSLGEGGGWWGCIAGKWETQNTEPTAEASASPSM